MLVRSRYAFTIGLLFVAACGPKAPAPSDAASAVPPATTHNITLAEYTIDAPDTLASGYTTFHAVNNGKELHHAQLIRLEQGKTVADFGEAMKTQGPPPAWVTWLGGMQMGSDVGIDLAPGSYAWLCLIPGADGMPHVMKGMIRPFTVTASKGTATAPPPDITITAADYKWTLSTPLTAGKHTIKFETAPGQPHEFALIRMKEGSTVADLAAWAQKPVGPFPAENVEGIPALQAGQGEIETIDLKPGHYVLMCFMPAPDGKDHASHGMVQEITIQ